MGLTRCVSDLALLPQRQEDYNRPLLEYPLGWGPQHDIFSRAKLTSYHRTRSTAVQALGITLSFHTPATIQSTSTKSLYSTENAKN